MLNGLVQMHDITQAQADTMQFPKMLTDTRDLDGQEGGRDDEHERPVGAVPHERGLQRAHRPGQ